MTEAITVDRREDVTLVEMDDGKVNALSTAFLEELGGKLEKATAQEQPVVLTGNGHAFSAGLDLDEVPTLDREGLRELLDHFKTGTEAILTAEVPVIAAFEGFAVAGGGIFALTCDYRVAHPEADIGCTELEVGIPFPPTDLSLLEARLPPQTVRRTILQPRKVHGQEALELGWIDELGEDPVEGALAATDTIGGTNPEAFRRAKQHLNEPILDTWESLFEGAFDEYVELLDSRQTQEAILQGIQRVMG